MLIDLISKQFLKAMLWQCYKIWSWIKKSIITLSFVWNTLHLSQQPALNTLYSILAFRLSGCLPFDRNSMLYWQNLLLLISFCAQSSSWAQKRCFKNSCSMNIFYMFLNLFPKSRGKSEQLKCFILFSATQTFIIVLYKSIDYLHSCSKIWSLFVHVLVQTMVMLAIFIQRILKLNFPFDIDGKHSKVLRQYMKCTNDLKTIQSLFTNCVCRYNICVLSSDVAIFYKLALQLAPFLDCRYMISLIFQPF